jgi:hypothetical protein
MQTFFSSKADVTTAVLPVNRSAPLNITMSRPTGKIKAYVSLKRAGLLASSPAYHAH